MRMGAEENRDLNSLNSLSAAGDHHQATFWELRAVRGAATEL